MGRLAADRGEDGSDDAASPSVAIEELAARLERAEAIRREFIANVSHELRTPLASLKALVETLEEGALEDPPAAREFLAQMHVEVDSLTQFVHELLELSRVESGQARFELEAMPPAPAAEDAVKRLRMQAKRSKIDLRLEAEKGLPAIWADPARVTQVLINLLHNAIKFTPEGGEVTVRVHRREGDGVVFTVTDTGIGIAADDLARVFERFYKVDRSRASGGTGLGLAISKHLVQAQGGQIWVESAGAGQGAAFSFALPVAPPAASGLPKD
jgi:two-component system phosphate regulon sensor histidine kinase PhoR